MPYPKILIRTGDTRSSVTLDVSEPYFVPDKGLYVGDMFIGPQEFDGEPGTGGGDCDCPTYTVFTATKNGLVPFPTNAKANQDHYLAGNGEWYDITTIAGNPGTSDGECGCGVNVEYDSASGSYTISIPSPEEGVEYYYIIKNTDTGGACTVTYPFLKTTKTFEIPKGDIGEVSVLYFKTPQEYVSRYAITSV